MVDRPAAGPRLPPVIALGYKASAEQFGPGELLGFALDAERRGFDSVAISDHFQPFRHTGGHAPAALPWLGALAARSERIRIGTSVSTPTLRLHPSMVAQAFATLACLAPGRVFLGVGTGESLNEVPALGIEWPGFGERLAAEEHVRAESRFIVTGDPDEAVERIAEYAELGFRHLVFHSPTPDQPRFLREFAAEVLPRLRSRYG